MTRRRFLVALAAAASFAATGIAWARQQVRVGMTLLSDTGQWTGGPSSFTYAWQHRTKPSQPYTTIQDGSAPTYLVTPGDAGSVIRVQVTAYNQAGASQPASSPPTTTIRAA